MMMWSCRFLIKSSGMCALHVRGTTSAWAFTRELQKLPALFAQELSRMQVLFEYFSMEGIHSPESYLTLPRGGIKTGRSSTLWSRMQRASDASFHGIGEPGKFPWNLSFPSRKKR